jgi:predicted PurR-regulated permease PerM
VTFYLIRDWDRMVAKLRAMIPPDDLPTADRLAREVDGALAGAVLFGLLGAFLAVPAAAVLGVLVRFAIERYRASSLYGGPPLIRPGP